MSAISCDWRVRLLDTFNGRVVTKTIHARSESEAAATALRSNTGAWVVVNVHQVRP